MIFHPGDTFGHFGSFNGFPSLYPSLVYTRNLQGQATTGLLLGVSYDYKIEQTRLIFSNGKLKIETHNLH